MNAVTFNYLYNYARKSMETIGLLNTLNQITILSEALQNQIKSILVEEYLPKRKSPFKRRASIAAYLFYKKGLYKSVLL